MSIKALEQYLTLLQPFLQISGVTEICINRPGELFIEKNGKFICQQLEILDYKYLETLAILVSESNHKNFPTPLLSGSLPSGERIQFVMHPACEKDRIICSIRKHQMRNIQLRDYEENDALKNFEENKKANINELRSLLDIGDIKRFIETAIHYKKNILISGGTGTGKTTFLNACLKCIPSHERLITVEDTREVVVNQPNAVHLLFNEENEQITALNIFKTCLRLRPDRIFLSELRGTEVWPYLRAANSGHPGTLSTVHADSPEGAFTQLVFMMQQAGSTSTEEQIRQYIKSIIHIVIQLKRDLNPGRHMYISDIYFSS